jgi:basic amino acid/polyamine antiporter, APA family
MADRTRAPCSVRDDRLTTLARRLGVYDLALIVMGSVIGSGIFRTPSVVAQRIHQPGLIFAAWIVGGIVALFGSFVLGELAARRPEGRGVYDYLRDAFHPVVAFAYGWTAMLASFTGGLAAAAVLFAGYFLSLTGVAVAPALIAVGALAVLALLNSMGVREGSNVQNGLTLLKVASLGGVIVAGFLAPAAGHAHTAASALARGTLGAFSVALIPVLFAYNGAAVANFMAPEAKHAVRALPQALWLGIAGVAVLYLLVNAVCIRVLGIDDLARTAVPASAVLLGAAGSAGARLASLAIAIATLGFMSNRMLTVPRLYHAMAQDGLFFRGVAWIDPRTRVPVVAIVLQAVFAMLIAISASYEHILNFVVSTVYLFNGLLALALFIIRARDRQPGNAYVGKFRIPWHPFSTAVYMLASWGVAIATIVAFPLDAGIGIAIVLSAIPVYFLWKH